MRQVLEPYPLALLSAVEHENDGHTAIVPFDLSAHFGAPALPVLLSIVSLCSAPSQFSAVCFCCHWRHPLGRQHHGRYIARLPFFEKAKQIGCWMGMNAFQRIQSKALSEALMALSRLGVGACPPMARGGWRFWHLID